MFLIIAIKIQLYVICEMQLTFFTFSNRSLFYLYHLFIILRGVTTESNSFFLLCLKVAIITKVVQVIFFFFFFFY